MDTIRQAFELVKGRSVTSYFVWSPLSPKDAQPWWAMGGIDHVGHRQMRVQKIKVRPPRRDAKWDGLSISVNTCGNRIFEAPIEGVQGLEVDVDFLLDNSEDFRVVLNMGTSGKGLIEGEGLWTVDLMGDVLEECIPSGTAKALGTEAPADPETVFDAMVDELLPGTVEMLEMMTGWDKAKVIDRLKQKLSVE